MPGVRNRVAVVTGAANGLGREIALVLAREGARVALGDMEAAGLERTEHAITAAGGVAVAVAGDLTEEDGAARLIGAAVERLGGLDILINNVGGSRNSKIWEMPVEDWDFTLRLNLRSTFLCTRAAVPAHDAPALRTHRVHVLGAREGTPWTAYYQGAPPIPRPRQACTASCATWPSSWPNTASTSTRWPRVPSTRSAREPR